MLSFQHVINVLKLLRYFTFIFMQRLQNQHVLTLNSDVEFSLEILDHKV